MGMETPDPPAEGGQAQGEPPLGAPVRRGRSQTSPLNRIVQAALTLLLLFLIFGVVLPQIADWSDVWDAISSLTAADALVLILLFVLIEVLKGAEQAVAIEPYTCSADAPNLAARGIASGWRVLAPLGEWEAVVEYRWDVSES